MSIIQGVANVLGGILGMFMVDKFGRRFNLKYGALLNMISLYVMALGVYFENTLFPTIAVIVYMLSFAFGLGGTTTLFCTEIVASNGVGIATAF